MRISHPAAPLPDLRKLIRRHAPLRHLDLKLRMRQNFVRVPKWAPQRRPWRALRTDYGEFVNGDLQPLVPKRGTSRLGPRARGDATRCLHRVGETPSAMRRSSLRESLRSWHAPLQIGAPAPMNTDDSLGFSRMGYPPTYTTLELRDGRQDILLRLEGTSPRGSEAPRDTL